MYHRSVLKVKIAALFLCLHLFISGSSFAQGNVLDSLEYLALKDLYENTNGTNWTNNTGWDMTLDPATVTYNDFQNWHGVSVTNGDVEVLSLRSNNLIGSLTSTIGNLTDLQTLDVTDNQLTNVPDEIGNLTALINLNLSENQFTTLPATIGNLSQLDQLVLQNNQLTVLPTAIGNLTGLVSLVLRHNELTSLPFEIGSLSSLYSLDISYNDVADLPYSFRNLSALRLFQADSALFTEIPYEVYQLSELQQLTIRWNQISTIGADIQNMAGLTNLLISGNNISTLPQELEDLTLLYILGLADNQITTIPAVIGNLTNLERLFVERNSLTTIPAELANISSLRVLNFSGNDLEHLPADLSLAAQITQLQMEDNGLSFEDIETYFTSPGNHPYSYFSYSPQDSIAVNSSDVKLSVDSTSSNNNYQWFQNGVQIAGATNRELNVFDVTHSAGDTYYCEVTNAVVTGLTLTSQIETFSAAPGFCSIVNSDTTNTAEQNGYMGQSFVATCDGLLNQIGLISNIDNTGYYLYMEIYQGEGTAGPVLASFEGVEFGRSDNLSDFQYIDVSSGGVNVVQGNTYTFAFTAGSPQGLMNDVNAGYTEGQAYYNTFPIPPMDMLFDFKIGEEVDQGLIPDEVEYLALKDLYDSTDGPNWGPAIDLWEFIYNPSTVTTSDFADWYGITVKNGDVTKIELGDFFMDGDIPASISNLQSLDTFNIQSSGAGELPSSIGTMTNLEALIYGGNSNTVIPDEIGNLTGLKHLGFGGNFLTTVPAAILNLTNLVRLDLYGGDITELPAGLENMSGLNRLTLHGNKLEFDDLEPYFDAPGVPKFADFGYDYQFYNDSVPITTNPDGTSISVNSSTNNQYQWYQNGVAISGINSNVLNLTDVTHNTGDRYYCEVTNTVVTGNLLTSHSATFTGTVAPASYQVFMSFGKTSNAAAPWNNALVVPAQGVSWTDLLDDSGANSNITISIETNWSGDYEPVNYSGMVTGDNSGVYPDAVIEQSYYFGGYGVPDNMQLRVSNLDTNYEYDFTFFGSRNAGGNRTTDYTIGAETVSLEAALNSTNTVTIYDVIPQPDGSILITLSKNAANTSFGYINALVIEATESLASSDVPDDIEYLALKAIYDNNGGLSWDNNSNWDPGLDPASVSFTDFQNFFGVTVTDGDITAIDLASNSLEDELALEIGNLTALTSIDFSGNQLTTIPSTVGQLTNLQNLNLSDNLLAAIPNEIGDVTSLQTLELNRNNLSDLPGSIDDLTSLSTLLLSENQLTSLPAALGNISSLQRLDIDQNEIADFPVGLSDIPLTQMAVQQNNFGFEDITPFFNGPGDPKPATFNYAPQGVVNTNISPDGTLLSLDGINPNNQYQWYQNGISIAGAISSSLDIADVTHSEGDTYYCQITNSIVTGLTLTSQTVTFSPSGPEPDNYQVAVNFGQNADADTPWNNTLSIPGQGVTWSNLLDDQGINRNISITVESDWSGDYIPVNTTGMVTGDNSGVYPDAVMQESYYFGGYNVPDVQQLRVSGLASGYEYDFTFFASRNAGGNRTADYSIGGETVSVEAAYNTTNTATIYNITPEADGTVLITLTKNANNTSFAYINSLVISATETQAPELGLVADNIEYQALQAIFNSTSGASWTDNTNWDVNLDPNSVSSTDFSNWYGVTVENGDITAIDLSNNNLEAGLPTEIGNLTRLISLQLEGNSLDQLPTAIGNLTSLVELNLSNNNIGDIPVQIENLNALQVLRLSSNELSDLPDQLTNMVNLRVLQLSNNSLTELSESFMNLFSLEHLALAGNNLSDFPEIVTQLGNLVYMDVSGNNLTLLSDQMPNLTNLDSLYVQDNRLTLEVLDPFLAANSFVDINYAPQGNSPATATETVLTGLGGGPFGEFQWFQNGVMINGANQSDLNIAAVTHTEGDTYYCEIISENVPGLTLTSVTLTFATPVSQLDNYQVSVNFSLNSDADAPWNNTLTVPAQGVSWTNLLDDQGTDRNIAITIETDWSGDYDPVNANGVVTGDNSGVYPDAVMQESYYFGGYGVPDNQQLRVSNLDLGYEYDFTFFGSRNGGGNRTTDYTIGSETVSINAAYNSTTIATIFDVTPESDGTILITLSKNAANTSFGYINSLVIEATEIVTTPPTNRFEQVVVGNKTDSIPGFVSMWIEGNDSPSMLLHSRGQSSDEGLWNLSVLNDQFNITSQSDDFGQTTKSFSIERGTGTSVEEVNFPSGNFGIGTASPDAALTVAGEIHTQEFRLSVEAGSIPDYVFESSYNLMTLEELEAYIIANKHLPNIKSANEYDEEGSLDIGELSLKILEKTEELTLYLIEQKKKINHLKEEVDSINKKQ